MIRILFFILWATPLVAAGVTYKVPAGDGCNTCTCERSVVGPDLCQCTLLGCPQPKLSLPPSAHTLIVGRGDGKPGVVFQVTHSGKLEFGPGWTPTKAAKQFADMFNNYFPDVVDNICKAKAK